MKAMQNSVTLKGRVIVWKGKVVHAEVPFLTYEFRGRTEGNPFVTDCMPLRLASHGRTRLEAVHSMRNMISAFLSELTRMGTLDAFLGEHGWTKRKLSPSSRRPSRGAKVPPQGDVAWIPPQVVSQLASVSMTR